MGIIADTVEKSRFALGLKTFPEWFDRPGFLTFKDLPYMPPAYQSLMDRTRASFLQMEAKAAAEYEAGFVKRSQSGMPAWAGPPGLPETRPITSLPEQQSGGVVDGVA